MSFAFLRLLCPALRTVLDGAGIGGRSLSDLVVGPVGRGHVAKADIACRLIRTAAEDGIDNLHGLRTDDGLLGAEAAVRVTGEPAAHGGAADIGARPGAVRVSEQTGSDVLRGRAAGSIAEGKCWPGINRIANDLGLSRSTVKRALTDLEKGGWLTRVPRSRENGSRTSNLYFLK